MHVKPPFVALVKFEMRCLQQQMVTENITGRIRVRHLKSILKLAKHTKPERTSIVAVFWSVTIKHPDRC